MHILPVVLTTRSRRQDLIIAIQTCEKNERLPKGLIAERNIKTFPCLEDRFGDIKEDQTPFAAKTITDQLKKAEKLLLVDACAFSESLSLLNAHHAHWGITDDVVDKLRLITYDETEPEKSDLILEIAEALRKIDDYEIHRSIVFITLEGHAFNFDVKLEEKMDSLPTRDFPQFNEIVEVKEENAEKRIRKYLETGKIVVVDKVLIGKIPRLIMAFNGFTSGQKKRLAVIG